MPINQSPILEIKKVSKDFSGIYALKDVSFKVFPGEVTLIVGENGAGKSTMMKILSGIYKDFSGDVLYEAKPVEFSNPRDASDQGIVIIHQELNLFPNLSVYENIFMGREITTKSGFLDFKKMKTRTKELLENLQLSIDPDTQLNQLKVGQQQLVEIARSLLFESKVLIMDEPTSALSDHEAELLFDIITELKSRGVAIIYISHKLDEIFKIGDRFVVLRDGENAGKGKIADTDREKLIKMMVGRNLKLHHSQRDIYHNEEILKVENAQLCHPEKVGDFLVNNVSFSLRKGQVLGIFGLMGSGRTELLEGIFGLYPERFSAKIQIKGKEKSIHSVKEAILSGIALVPEDRKVQGLIMAMNVNKNISLACLDKISKGFFLSSRNENELGWDYINKMNIQVPDMGIDVDKLSGGNQQKVVISKWLATEPAILLLDEPTRGIDIGSKTEIYELIDKLTSDGMGIIMVSSELPEILAVSDEIIVMCESKLTARMKREDADEEKIMNAAISEKE